MVGAAADGVAASAGAEGGDIRATVLALAAGDAGGDLDSDGELGGTRTGRFIRTPTGTVCGGAILMDISGRRAIFTRTLTDKMTLKGGAVRHGS